MKGLVRVRSPGRQKNPKVTEFRPEELNKQWAQATGGFVSRISKTGSPTDQEKFQPYRYLGWLQMSLPSSANLFSQDACSAPKCRHLV